MHSGGKAIHPYDGAVEAGGSNEPADELALIERGRAGDVQAVQAWRNLGRFPKPRDEEGA
jgi:hypothetical protein